jgi:hypothetical protein
VPLRNIVQNTSARHGSSTNRQIGIAFGSVFGITFLTGLVIFLYLIYYQRLQTRARARTRKQPLSLKELKELYLNRVSRRRLSNQTRPAGGSRSSETATDPFAMIALDLIPPLELSKTGPMSVSMGAHRDSRWKNFEDYGYM